MADNEQQLYIGIDLNDSYAMVSFATTTHLEPETVSSVAGSSCGRYAQAALLPTLDFLKLELTASPFTSVAFDREQFTTSTLAVTEGLKADLAHQAAALLAKLDRA